MNHIISNLFNQFKQGLKDGRQEIESNGKTVAENESEAKAYVLRELKDPMNYVETIAVFVAVPYLCRAMHCPKWLTAVLTLGTGEFMAYARNQEEYKAGWKAIVQQHREAAELRRETKNLNDLTARLQYDPELQKKRMQEFSASLSRGTDAYLAETFKS